MIMQKWSREKEMMVQMNTWRDKQTMEQRRKNHLKEGKEIKKKKITTTICQQVTSHCLFAPFCLFLTLSILSCAKPVRSTILPFHL